MEAVAMDTHKEKKFRKHLVSKFTGFGAQRKEEMCDYLKISKKKKKDTGEFLKKILLIRDIK